MSLFRVLALEYDAVRGVPRHCFDMDTDPNFPLTHLEPSFLKNCSLQRLKFDYSEPPFLPLNAQSSMAQLNGYTQICLVSLRPMHDSYYVDNKNLPQKPPGDSSVEAPINPPEDPPVRYSDLFFQDLALSYKAIFVGVHKYCLKKLQPVQMPAPIAIQSPKHGWSKALHAYLINPERNSDVIYHDPHVIVVKDKYQKVVSFYLLLCSISDCLLGEKSLSLASSTTNYSKSTF